MKRNMINDNATAVRSITQALRRQHMNGSATQKRTVRGAIAGIGFAVLGVFFLGAKDPDAVEKGLATLRGMQEAFHAVAARVTPAVVEVHVIDAVRLQPQRGPFRNNPDNGPAPREFRQEGLGSGVIIDRRGNTVYVLTNNHVAGSADRIQVKLSDNREFTARLVGKDEQKDLALISFETKDAVPVAELGDSDTVAVGDWVLAVGNPMGFSGTVTAGIVSAVGRDSTQAMGAAGFTDYLQTDAAINQGNSGGALVNISGQVVGINTWIASPSGGNVGLGFAIPINNAKKDIGDFIARGKVEYGWLGVTIGDASQALADDLKLGNTGGALVNGLFSDGPAARAGILPGDYIVSFDKTPVKGTAQFLRLIGNLAPGRTAEFEIVRNGARQTLRATLGVRSDEKTLSGLSDKLWPGFAVAPLTADVKSAFALKDNATGVAVVDLPQGGPAAKAGLRPGDVITDVAGARVANAADYFKSLNAAGKNVALRVTRGADSLTLTLSK
jgi:Do/DeqQ family serine protease